MEQQRTFPPGENVSLSKRIIACWLVPDNPPESCDLLIALSYGLDKNADLTPMTKAVVDKAVELWQKNPRAKIIMSTGDNQRLGVSNARKMAEYAQGRGVAQENIIEEARSKNTYENVKYSVGIAQKLGAKKPALVAYDLHMRRALLTFRKLKIPIGHISAVSERTVVGAGKYWQLNRLTMLVYELLATIYSHLRNWV